MQKARCGPLVADSACWFLQHAQHLTQGVVVEAGLNEQATPSRQRDLQAGGFNGLARLSDNVDGNKGHGRWFSTYDPDATSRTCRALGALAAESGELAALFPTGQSPTPELLFTKIGWLGHVVILPGKTGGDPNMSCKNAIGRTDTNIPLS